MRKIPCLREWRTGKAAVSIVSTWEQLIRQQERSGFQLAGDRQGCSAANHSGLRRRRGDPRRPRFHRPRLPGIAECQGRFQESVYLEPGSRLLATLDECAALKSTIKSASGQRKPTFCTDPISMSDSPISLSVVGRKRACLGARGDRVPRPYEATTRVVDWRVLGAAD